jgi:calcineurin-binding protein cabin-1
MSRGYTVALFLTNSCSLESDTDDYGNLYYYIAQAGNISASDSYTGFVLKREGEFVEKGRTIC